MFPKSKNTPRERELRTKIEAEKHWEQWPVPTQGDLALIGLVVVQFGYVDLNLRRLADLFERTGQLPQKWIGKTMKATMANVAEAVQSSPVWTGPLATMASVLQELEEHRALRNLLAHCVIRRFPEDDALFFLFISRRDYVAVYATEPPPFTALSDGIDCEDIRNATRRVEDLLEALSMVTADLENRMHTVAIQAKV